MTFYNALKDKVRIWRENKYPSDFPAIFEIFEFSLNSDFLRKPQFEALETYWYLRLVEGTPHIFDLYKRLFQRKQLLEISGLTHLIKDLPDDLITDEFINNIFKKVINDDEFARQYKLEALRETLLLKYPSYIFALSMGAGKTVLIGTIIATEFAMALDYPESSNFIKNALVFAPGKTILGALKEISDIPYEKILPPRLYKEFITSVKFTYTKDKERDISVISESSFNIIITNTEKIRLRKEDIRKDLFSTGEQALTSMQRFEDRKELIANQRLEKIASLPNLAIFSDEAHHTYGMKLGEELKRVRQTVDYLAEKTSLVAVVNTTGTPYYGKQLLKDVVYWYGLSQGIKDGILKEVRGNIVAYSDVEDEQFIRDVVIDFFKNYRDVKTYDGSYAKLAIYFPQIEDLKNAKTVVEKTLLEIKEDPSVILEVHSESNQEIQDLFDNRINDPHLPYRVFLLVNKGTEGWNCPSLYATALARELRSSNNFCLQAATRCLRQVSGNIHKAKIYLSSKNVKILDAQLRETYGETLQELNSISPDLRKEKLVLRKIKIPPVLLKRKVQKVVAVDKKLDFKNLEIRKPDSRDLSVKKVIYDLKDIPEKKGVLITHKEEEFLIEEDFIDVYSLSVELSSLYRLPLLPIYEKIKALYPEGEIPEIHVLEIRKQLEEQLKNYQIKEEEEEVALALIKPQGFSQEKIDGNTVYVTEIVYHKDREHLLLKYEDFKSEFGFHYSPYNFDSAPEKDFFISIVLMLNEDPDDIEDIYFTGAITDPNKTDFIFEYKGKDGNWHNYTPDFLIKMKSGKMLIVEIKAEPFRDEEKEKLMREIEGLNTDKLKYEILITDKEEIGTENINKIKDIIRSYRNKKKEML